MFVLKMFVFKLWNSGCLEFRVFGFWDLSLSLSYYSIRLLHPKMSQTLTNNKAGFTLFFVERGLKGSASRTGGGHIYIYTYVYTERESDTYMHMYVYIYIYIYIHMHVQYSYEGVTQGGRRSVTYPL